MDVGLDALGALLRVGIESESLEFKRTWDPNARGDVIELAKDFAAMESLPEGGYIVVGADDDGNASGTFAGTARADFDEQRVRSKLSAVLGEPLGIDVALHDWAGDPYLVIGVRPHPDGFRIMNQAGNYQINGKTKSLWSEGDVFVRRGTSSVKWSQHDVRAILERIVAIRKEAWRVDIQASAPASPAASDPVSARISAESAIDTFVAGVLNLIRDRDLVGIDLIIREIVAAAVAPVNRPIEDPEAVAYTLGEFLLRLDVVAALVARYGLKEAFAACVSAYRTIYDASDEDYSQLPRKFPQGQEQLLSFVYALGSVLVDGDCWEEIAQLSRMAPYATHNGYWKTLLRKAEVMSARAEIGRDPDTGKSPGVIERAKPAAGSLFAALGEDPSGKDLTTLLVQFDVYRGIAATSAENDKLGAYTNFAYYRSHRAEPAFSKAIHGPVREALFQGDDSALRVVFETMDTTAQSEGARYSGWYGFEDSDVIRFINAK